METLDLILNKTVNDFPEGDRFVIDERKIMYYRKDIVHRAMLNYSAESVITAKAIPIKELDQILFDCTQLFDGWHTDVVWSEWDESIRKRVSEFRQKYTYDK